MEKSLWKVKYIQAPHILVTAVLRNGHTKGILYKLPKKRITEKTCKDIIELLKDEIGGTTYLGSCIVNEEIIKKATVVKEYEI